MRCVAVTRTAVCSVPALTTVCTVPSAPETAVAGDRLNPPAVVLRLNATVTPGRAPPLESTTLNTTVDVSFSPVPLSPMEAGVADTNWIEPIEAAATVTVPVAVRFVLATAAVAVMTSGPLHPFAVYVASMVPVVLVTVSAVLPAVLVPEAAIVASPVEMQVELNVTVTDCAV